MKSAALKLSLKQEQINKAEKIPTNMKSKLKGKSE